MTPQEIIKKVKKVEIKSKQLSSMIFSGEYHTKFKGRGMHFSEVREYQVGDDIRNIDWNVTAKHNKPFVKLYEEEREMVVMLLVDISASNLFGTNMQFKKDLIVEISAILSFSAIENKDNIGVIFFSDKVEKIISPKKGKAHVLKIIREILIMEPTNKKTDIASALKFFSNVQKKKSIVFLISDFLTGQLTEGLKILQKKHDVIAVKISDKREEDMPNFGFIRFRDLETNQVMLVDTSDINFRENYRKNRNKFNETVKNIFIKEGIDMVELYTGEDYILPLIKLFQKRMK